mgnify:FL=1|jgi:para-aminobenzoate synthetase component 1
MEQTLLELGLQFLDQGMNKIITIKIKWINPIIVADNVSYDKKFSDNFVFLYSAINHENKNSKSYLSFYTKELIKSDNFSEIEKKILNNEEEKYFGYLSYELKNNIERFKEINKNYIKIDKLYFSSFHFNLEFNHDKKEIICKFSEDLKDKFHNFIKNIDKNINLDQKKLRIINLDSNFNDQEYLRKINAIQNRIKNGDVYQANLTRKFFGKIKERKNYFDIFKSLMQISPGNYSSFLKFEDLHIISSSPELFLDIDYNKVKSSPIKGTSPRSKNKMEDQKNLEYLQNSDKERAENLMIVDLVRNDLSKNCQNNSVEVKNLFKILSFKKIYHMVSEIIGKKLPDRNVIDIIKGCFPPGSMTGAPKIKSIEVCDELEKMERGVYAGAIGLVNKNICKLSVVIRTLIIFEDKFEFQSGGAITYNSDPEKELQESKDKNKGIMELLEIK